MRRAACGLALGVLLATSSLANADSAGEATVYPVSELVLEYVDPAPDLPPLGPIASVSVALGEDPDRFTVPSANRPTRVIRIEDIGREGAVALDRAALIEICTAVVRSFQEQDRVARCFPHREDIQRGEDLRGERTDLRLEIVMARVAGIRTYASGERSLAKDAGATNNPVHADLLAKAPVSFEADAAHVAPLLDTAQLEEYVARLNRHPGRSVGLVYSRASSRDGGLTVDLVVTETKPWAVYLQSTDTGTEATGEYRNRVGFSHTQLTGNDDVLQLEYLTSDFDQVQASSASYEAPLFGFESARFKLFGAMSMFDNEDLGIFRSDFSGTRSEAGLQLVANVFQRRSFFVDVSAGARAEALSVENGLLDVTARDRFLLPSVGLRFESRSPFAALIGGLEFEWNLDGLAGTDADASDGIGRLDGAGGLGRLEPDADYRLLRFDLAGSMFLEPWLDWDAWSDFSTPQSSTLAHELSLRMTGQYAFDDRLVPQEQGIAGGRDTVRGYEQAIAVGDSVFVGSLEYRYHFPRALRPRPATRLASWLRWLQGGADTFRVAPDQPAGSADWDLVLKAFVDGARVLQSDRRSFESHESLLGVGVGTELRLRQSFVLSLDVGVPLATGRLIDVDRHHPVLHFSLTVLY